MRSGYRTRGGNRGQEIDARANDSPHTCGVFVTFVGRFARFHVSPMEQRHYNFPIASAASPRPNSLLQAAETGDNGEPLHDRGRKRRSFGVRIAPGHGGTQRGHTQALAARVCLIYTKHMSRKRSPASRGSEGAPSPREASLGLKGIKDNDHPIAENDNYWETSTVDPAASRKVNQVLLLLARLIGRRIACEGFAARFAVANDNRVKPPDDIATGSQSVARSRVPSLLRSLSNQKAKR
jgi:hypothetical protein